MNDCEARIRMIRKEAPTITRMLKVAHVILLKIEIEFPLYLNKILSGVVTRRLSFLYSFPNL